MKRRYLNPKQVEEMFGLNRRTLANLRWLKKGPAYIKLGKQVLYPVQEIEKWIKENGTLIKTINE